MRAAALAVAALAFSLVLAACGFNALVPKEHVAFARAVVMLVQNRDAEGLEAVCDDRLWPHLTPDLREHMAGVFPHEQPMTIDVASYRASTVNGAANVAIILRYVYPRTVVRAAVAFRSAEHGFLLTGLRVAPGDEMPNGPDSASGTREL